MTCSVSPFPTAIFDISAAAVQINRIAVDGGDATTVGGDEFVTVSVGDGMDDVVEFTHTTTSSEEYVYILTDDVDFILQVLPGNSFNFENAPPGICFVIGLSYSGNLLAEVGDDINTVQFSDGCFEISNKVVQITRLDGSSPAVDGGTVTIADGSTETTLCVNDGVADAVQFTHTTTSSASYTYVVVDENNLIIDFPAGNEVDFDNTPPGICFVGGVSYTGNITAQPGGDLFGVPISDGDFDISAAAVQINRIAVDGGDATTVGGNEFVTVSVGDGMDDVVEFTHTTTSSENYVYILTDDVDFILEVLPGNSFNFENAPVGICFVIGLSYSGNLLAQVGDDINTVQFSDGCFEISNKVVQITRLDGSTPDVDGGTVTMADGSTETTLCVNDGVADAIQFTHTTTSSASYTYVVVDENNLIIDFPAGNEVDFDNAPPGICFVGGVSYTGNITAQPGDDLFGVAFSDGDFDISVEAVQINRIAVDGGDATTVGGDEFVVVSVGDGMDDVVEFTHTTTSSEEYVYILTDDVDFILEVLPGNSFNFENAPVGTCFVIGLSYSGNLLAQVGDDINTVQFSDGCFEISDKVVEITRVDGNPMVDGGMVSSDIGATEVLTCTNDGNPDTITFVNTSTSPENYAYVITDENNIMLALEATDHDFDTAPPGVCLVYGISFTGALIPDFGADISTLTSSSGLFELSQNFITVTRDNPDAGTVTTAAGETEVTVTVGDGNDDIIQFVHITNSVFNYTYVVVDEDNIIIDFPSGNEVNFENAPPGICFVGGVSYTGNITAQPGDDLFGVPLSDDCFEISEEAVQINREEFVIDLDGGTVTTLDGATEITLCVGDGESDIVLFAHETTSDAAYSYVVTDENGIILGLPDQNEVDFENAPPGTCFVGGVSYTGDVTAIVGDDIFITPFSDGDFELSEDVVQINRLEGVTTGTINLEDGSTEIEICVGDEVADELFFFPENEGYVFVVTDENDVILEVLLGNSFDFENAPAGICHVWAVRLTGDLLLEAGDVITATAISDECSALSQNWIEVNRVDTGPLCMTPINDLGKNQVDQLRIFPNPTDHRVFIDLSPFEGMDVILSVTDLVGNKLLYIPVKQSNTDNYSVDLSDLREGCYMAWVSDENGKMGVGKLVVLR